MVGLFGHLKPYTYPELRRVRGGGDGCAFSPTNACILKNAEIDG